MRKIPFAGIEPTSQRVKRLHGTSELPGRPVCTNDLIVLHPLGIFSFILVFTVRKIPFAGIELTSQLVRGLRGTSELPGRPAVETLGIHEKGFQQITPLVELLHCDSRSRCHA